VIADLVVPAARVNDDDFEALLLEHVHAVRGDHDRVRLRVAAVEGNARFRRVLELETFINFFRLQNRRPRVRIPPGCKFFRNLHCNAVVICIIIVCTRVKNK
jgi:hypothetical protein